VAKRTVVVRKRKLDNQLISQTGNMSPTDLAIAARRQEDLLKEEQRRIAAGGNAPTVLELDEWE
jgi:hypothetical protein